MPILGSGSYPLSASVAADDVIVALVSGDVQETPFSVARTFVLPDGLRDAADYSATTTAVIATAETTTDWTTTGSHTGGDKTLDAVNFTTGANSIKWVADMNAGFNGKFYYTPPTTLSTSDRTLVAFDLRIQEDGSGTNPQADVVAKVADGAALGGTVNTVSLQGVPNAVWVTIVLPLTGISTIGSVGIHRTATEGEVSPSSLRCIFNIDNVRFLDETKLDVALGSSSTAAVWVPGSYTPDAVQLPLYIPSGKAVIDPAKGVFSGFNNCIYLHAHLAHVVGAEDGTTDVAQAIGRIINDASPGQTIVGTPGATYRFEYDLVISNSHITIDFTGCTIALAHRSNNPFFTLSGCTDVTVRGGLWLGYYPLAANGSTLTTVAGTPTTNGTGKELDALDEEVKLPTHTNWLVGSHFSRHIPQQLGIADDGLGARCYWEFVLSDSAQVANDCVISVYDDYWWSGDGTSTLLEATTLTLTATPTTYRVSYFPSDPRQRHKITVKKATATANTITIASVTPYGENEYNSTYDIASCFLLATSSGITIRDCWVEGFGGDAVQVSDVSVNNVVVDNVTSRACRRQGMSFNQGSDMWIRNCMIGQPGRSALDFEPFDPSWFTKRITVTNIKMYNVVNYALAMGNWARNLDFTVDGIDLHEARIGMLYGGAQRSIFRNLNNLGHIHGLANDFEIAGINTLFENLRSIKRIDFMVSTNNADIGEGAGEVIYTPAGNIVRNITMPNGRLIDIDVAGYTLEHPMFLASAAPTTGTHTVGEVVFNAAPAAGGFIGWVCVTAGTPGTWRTWGVISA